MPSNTHIDNIASPIFVLDITSEGRPVYTAFNAFARQVSGRPLSDYLNNTACEVYPGSWGEAAYLRHRQVALSGVSATYELDLPLGGTTRKVRTTLTPVLDPGGRVTRIVGGSTDITAEVRAREARQRLGPISDEMERFITIAAHDLRGPMRRVGMLAEMLREDFVDLGDGKADMLDMLDEVAVNSMQLISDLMAHARAIEAVAQTSCFELSALCADVCKVLDPLRRHRMTSPAARIETDRTTVQIALRNLIEHAIHRGGPDAAHLDLSLNAGHGMLEFMLTDLGGSFDPDSLRILDGADFVAGGGYGLLGVHRLIHARGGTITAMTSHFDGISRVTFTLPGKQIDLRENFAERAAPWFGKGITGTINRHTAA